MQDLIQKYNVPGPRYTSYPTVPFWDEAHFDIISYTSTLKTNKHDGISLYIHLPFCESMCTFCGCHKYITTRHDVEETYLAALLKEWDLYLQYFQTAPAIVNLHLGGGTPTFFSAQNLEKLIKAIAHTSKIAKTATLSIEGHPNSTSLTHLTTLHQLGFRRISFGVQDYDANVQKAIHRIQSFEQVQLVTEQARNVGFTSISHDLVYGLPLQTLATWENTLHKTLALKPDTLSLYSYAHVPWVKGVGQRGYSEADLPSAALKAQLYAYAKRLLVASGYIEVGMDHFALPTDALCIATSSGTLHRNFMGYTSAFTPLLIGLGMSAISESPNAYAQNHKTLKAYYAALAQAELAIFKGHTLSKSDQIIKKHILNLMCRFSTTITNSEWNTIDFNVVKNRLYELEQDGLVTITDQQVTVTLKGRPFVRNVAMAFDAYLHASEPHAKMFSMTV